MSTPDHLNEEIEYLPQAARRRYDGSEPVDGLPGLKLVDYWGWAYSDVLENVQRGIFAEFLVAAALGISDVDRVGWNGYDLDYGGYKLEVKSSAYLQSWRQKQHTKISIEIGPRKQWVEGRAVYEDARYVADCYIFALFGDRHGPSANVIDATHWEFFVVPIQSLIEHVGTAKSVSERRLHQITDSVRISVLRDRIDRTRAGEIFVNDPSAKGGATRPVSAGKTKTYLVARRKTREHGVLVCATDYQQAHLLARADSTIASFGTGISAESLSNAKIREALRDGVKDLR
jgi:hypothetical protein